MSHIVYYIAILLMIVVGFLLVKKIAGCMFKLVVSLVLLAILIALYWYFFASRGVSLPLFS